MDRASLLQLVYSALNIATTALDEFDKLKTAEATGELDEARENVANRANAIADRLRAP